MKEFAPVQAGSLSAQAFGVIKDAIFTGRIKPGEAVRELVMARSLGVSQATIREALAQLEGVGLIVRQANRRTSVTSFTREEVRDRLQVRMLLEEHAGVQAAARAGKAELGELGALAAAIGATIEGGDHYEHVRADIEFHRRMWGLAGSPMLSQMLDQVTTPLFAFLSVLHHEAQRPLRATRPHERIVRALRSGEEGRIRAEIRAHIEGSYAEFLTSPSATLGAYARGGAGRAGRG